MPISSSERLGPHGILPAIGAGGMGEVYRARDARLERIVDIKVLPAHSSDRADLQERFEREARAIASEHSGAPAYAAMNGRRMSVNELDIVGRLLTMQSAHPSSMGAGAFRTGAAAMVNGTIVNELCGAGGRQSGRIRIGHPQGVMEVSVKAIPQNCAVKIAGATISRTARRIVEGVAYVPADCFIAAGERKS